MKSIFTWLEKYLENRKDSSNTNKATNQPTDPQQHKDPTQRQLRDLRSVEQLQYLGTWAQETEAEKRARRMQELLVDAGLVPGEPKSILPDVELNEINKRSATPTP